MENNNKVKTTKSRNVIILVAAAVLIVSTALAWFISTNNMSSNTFGVSNFKAEADCYFMTGENNQTRIEVTNFIETGTNLINLSTSSSDDNYIGNFRVDIIYRGEGYGYLRAKVVTRAKDQGNYVELMDSKSAPYILSAAYSDENGNNQASWYDNRNIDFCYYYAQQLSGSNTTDTTLPFITGVNTTDVDSGFDLAYLHNNGYTLSVAIETDMVQINRYPQIWGINALPWKS